MPEVFPKVILEPDGEVKQLEKNKLAGDYGALKNYEDDDDALWAEGVEHYDLLSYYATEIIVLLLIQNILLCTIEY